MLVEVEHLTKEFRVGRGRRTTLRAVDDVSFSIEQGRTFGLVGESGCGKTTVARLLAKLYEPQSGRITIDGRDLARLKGSGASALRRDVQMVFQDPYSSLDPRMSVERILKEPLAVHHIGDGTERRARVEELLELVGLDPRFRRRYPHEFSGGQRQRIGIARAIALNPKFVILDEAVSALDVSVQSQILNLFQELQAELGLTYLFISHDLAVVEYLCDEVAVMYLGAIVERGSKSDLFRRPAHPYTRALLSAVPSVHPKEGGETILLKGEIPSATAPPSGCRFRTRCLYAMDRCAIEVPAPIDLGGGHTVACHLYEEGGGIPDLPTVVATNSDVADNDQPVAPSKEASGGPGELPPDSWEAGV